MHLVYKNKETSRIFLKINDEAKTHKIILTHPASHVSINTAFIQIEAASRIVAALE